MRYRRFFFCPVSFDFLFYREITIMNVCVFGAGNMGARIAEVFLSHDHEVALVDVQERFLQNGYARIENDYEFLVRKGKMEEKRKAQLLSS